MKKFQFHSIIGLNHPFLPLKFEIKVNGVLLCKLNLGVFWPGAFDFHFERQLKSKDSYWSKIILA